MTAAPPCPRDRSARLRGEICYLRAGASKPVPATSSARVHDLAHRLGWPLGLVTLGQGISAVVGQQQPVTFRFGEDTEVQYLDNTGRPHPVLPFGRRIDELCS